MVYEFLEQILNEIIISLGNKLLKEFKKIKKFKDYLYKILVKFKDLRDAIKKFYLFIDNIREVLRDEEITEKESKEKFQSLIKFAKKEKKNKSNSKILRSFFRNALKVMISWGPKLFTYKSVEGLPRTNNALEEFIKELKSKLRRTSGNKAGNKSFLIHGEELVFVEWDLKVEDYLKILKETDYNKVFKKCQEYQKNSNQRYLERQALNNWENCFQNLTQNILKELGVSINCV